MTSALIDIRYAARTLRRNAGFTAAAVTALSLGIAANTAIFSVVNKVLLEPLPYPEPDGLVQLVTRSQVGDQNVVSIPKYSVWRDRTESFEYMAAYDFAGPSVNLTDDEFPQPLETARVSADYLPLFGADVSVGRSFSNSDDQPGAPCAVVLGHDLWRTRFKSRTSVVGNPLSLDHQPCQVVGVLAPGFAAEKPIDIWKTKLPLTHVP